MAKINTLLHLSDEASSVILNKKGTVWENDENIKTVQDALGSIQEQSIKMIKATDSQYGVVKLANDDDLKNGIGRDDVVTSEQMFKYNSKPLATYISIGTTQYATQNEVKDGVVDNRSVTPKELQYKFDNTNSTTTQYGTIKIAEESMVIPGVNNETVMTPYLVKLAIDMLSPEVAVATEANTGTVVLADIPTTLAGKVRKGYAVSPFSFSKSNATDTEFGTVRIASVAEAYNENNKDKLVISPYVFQNAKATMGKRGTIMIASDSEVRQKTNNEKAVTPLGLKYYSDLIERVDNRVTKLENVKPPEFGFVPVGSIVESFNIPNSSTGFVHADGRTLNKNNYPELFNAIGYKFGGSGDSFAIPDMRGLFTRGTGKGKFITGNLSDGVTGGSPGAIQSQQVRKHKHISPLAENPNVGWSIFGVCNTFRSGMATGRDYDNKLHWTNDGTPYDGTPNPDGIIGNETRPWNISVYKLIRIK